MTAETIATPGESIGPQNPATSDGGSSMSRELLPCPFCGSHDIRVTKIGWRDWYRVGCSFDECSAVGPILASRAEAITAWNERVAAKTPTDLLEAAKKILGLLDPEIIGSKGSALEDLRAAIAKAEGRS